MPQIKKDSTVNCRLGKTRCMAMMVVAMISMAVCAVASAGLTEQLLLNRQTAKTQQAEPAQTEPPTESSEEIAAKIEELQTIRARLENGDDSLKPPDGIKAEELTEFKRIVDTLLYFYQEGLNALSAIEEEKEKLTSAEAKLKDWQGFVEATPYSILMLYTLEDESVALQGKESLLDSSLSAWNEDSQMLQDELAKAQSAERRAVEQLERADSPEEKSKAAWRREFAQWRLKMAERDIWFQKIQIKLSEAKLRVVKVELALLDKKIAKAKPLAKLSEEDLAKVSENLQTTINNLMSDQQKAVSEKARWAKEREALSRNLESLKKAMPANPPNGGEDAAELETLDMRLKVAETWLDATTHEIESLGHLAIVNARLIENWRYQFTLLNSTDPVQRRNAMRQVERDFSRLQQWQIYIQENLRLAINDENSQQLKLESLNMDSPQRRYALQALDARRHKRQVIEKITLFADKTGHTLSRWLAGYRQTDADQPIARQLEDARVAIAEQMGQLLKYEVFTVDDEVDLDGKKLQIVRGVTIGKIAIALTAFVLGFWLVKWFAGRFQRMLSVRFSMDKDQANMLRRWMQMALDLILLVTVLTWARIPLTAFAFLGGALAIGVGFGTQTLLKNLMSGLMVLIERKIKVGDIVEVDTIIGTITEIDIRSSTVRGFDGIETMIPNATFVENKVTNWTYTNSKIRRSVKLGVAYGSPVRDVTRLLLECASRHGQVLKDPVPFVWLEDFGDNALTFGLYFWLEMGPNVSSLQVMSDLRCMILESLARAGVAIPFPQRDLRLVRDQPIPVEVVGDSAGRSQGKPTAPA